MISARDIHVVRGGRAILSGVSCDVAPARVTVIMGKNGAGKSTLLHLLAGGELKGADAGTVEVDQRAMKDYSSLELATRRAVLAQSTQLGFPLPVREVVELGCYHRYHDMTTSQRKRQVSRYLELLQLTPMAGRAFPTLSGGEKQRVLLAKCLLQLDAERIDNHTNRYLLLDEPTAALDLEQEFRFLELATRLARRRGIGVLAVLHDLNLAARFADDLFFLKDGRPVASGPRAAVLNPPTIRATFDVDCLIQPHPHYDGPLITTIPYEPLNIAPAAAPN